MVENDVPGGLEKSLADEAIRREVLNVLKSYTGYFDVFSELLQNALDAVDVRKTQAANFTPRIYIDINIADNRIRITDNGCGMDLKQFKFCFRPNVSFKSRKDSRGHKGVGATFIAYGFSSVRLFTKQNDTTIAGQLNNGRRWAEDSSGSFSRPSFTSIDFYPPELLHEPSGTSIEVFIDAQQRPQLPWLQATNSDQWLDILRMKTPIGGIYLTSASRDINVEYHINVTDISGNVTSKIASDIDYFYPHEIPLINKTKSIDDIEKKIQSIQGDPTTRLQRLPDEYRRLDAVWEVWKSSNILEDATFIRNLDESQKILIEKHDITIYGCFISSATTWTRFQKEVLRVRPTAVLLRGGLQLATDFMPQGDLSVIPLTSTIGYQNNTHLLVHLRDGNPDMGRKVFQPEIKALADELSRRAVDIFKRYLTLMREDTGAPLGGAARDLRDFIKQQEARRDNAPLALKWGDFTTALLSEPQSEQDVISLFHELVGGGILSGYGFFATTESERYDCTFCTNYAPELSVYSEQRPLGVSQKSEMWESVPYVLEYKFDSDALVSDFEKEKKFVKDIDLLVCWQISAKTKQEFAISSFLIGDEGSLRMFFGATHALYQGREKRMEVVCLSDLVSYLRDPEAEIARQRQLFV
ncbi:MAG: ATP-binding protein [Methyloceanibacter sp.]